MNSLLRIAILITWFQLNITTCILSTSLDPEGPGPPKISQFTSSDDISDNLDLNLSGNNREVNIIQAHVRSSYPTKSYKEPIQEHLSPIQTSVNENHSNKKYFNENGRSISCTKNKYTAKKYVHDDDTVVAANINNGDKSLLALELDVINDDFETKNEPLIPDVLYKGK